MRRALAAAGWAALAAPGTAVLLFMAWMVIAGHGGQTP